MKLFYLLILGIGAYAWDNDELEIFDLVEEVNSNFYGVLGIEKVSMSDNISFKNINCSNAPVLQMYHIILLLCAVAGCSAK